jgi:hypothetical protein
MLLYKLTRDVLIMEDSGRAEKGDEFFPGLR